MRRLLLLPLLLGPALLLAADAKKAPPPPAAPRTLADADGKPHAIAGIPDARAVVLFFTATQCPSANRYPARLAELHKTYAAKGVSFFAVYANAFDTADEVRRHLREAPLPFPALLDPDQRAADAFGVEVTPTAVVLDPTGKVRFRGPVDENRNEQLAKKRYLADGLDALLAGKEVPAAPEPVGCFIERKQAPASNAKVTFAEVAPVLHRHCATCHRPGNIGPFPLLTYEQARRQAANIKAYTRSHAMPPWKPVNEGLFLNERRLSQPEIDLLAAWADAGAPLGDAAKVPAAPKFPGGWQLGEPDLVLESGEYELAAEGNDEYRCFVLNPKLTEDRYVRAVEFIPGNRRVVHHVMTYIDGLGVSAFFFSKDGKPGYSTAGTGPGFVPLGDIGGWAPGSQPVVLPEGTGRLLPKGSRIALELHFHKSGKVEKDRTKIGIHFAKAPVKKPIESRVIVNTRFQIPPGEERYAVRGGWHVKEDVHVVGILPHMHLIGREMVVVAEPPDGPKRTLVHIKDWDFNWQETYYFKEPVALPAGTVVHMTAWFDNSDKNPNNPHKPPKLMRFGLQTTDEMAVAYLNYTKDK